MAQEAVSAMDNPVGCVVIPTYEDFLGVLIDREDGFTTLIWPGHGVKANRMATPYK